MHNTGLPEAFQMGVEVAWLTPFIHKVGKAYVGPPTTPRQDPTSSDAGLITGLTTELQQQCLLRGLTEGNGDRMGGWHTSHEWTEGR